MLKNFNALRDDGRPLEPHHKKNSNSAHRNYRHATKPCRLGSQQPPYRTAAAASRLLDITSSMAARHWDETALAPEAAYFCAACNAIAATKLKYFQADIGLSPPSYCQRLAVADIIVMAAAVNLIKYRRGRFCCFYRSRSFVGQRPCALRRRSRRRRVDKYSSRLMKFLIGFSSL